MATEPLASAFSNLDEDGRRSLLGRMTLPDLCSFFENLEDDQICAHTISLTEKKDRGSILKSMDVAKCVRMVNLLSRKNQASALFSMGESKRLEVLNHMDDASFRAAVQNLWLREMRRRDKRGSCSVLYGSIVTGAVLDSYPETAWNCIICDGSYSVGQSILGADCAIHSFHKDCEPPEGICPKCQHPADVFPLGDVRYLENNDPKRITIAGLGRHRNDQRNYVLVSFHAENREMYWYELHTIEREFGHENIERKMIQFLLSQLADAQ